MAEMAEAIGRMDEATRYRALRAKIGSAFTVAFVSADGRIASGTQTAYVLGLNMRLIPGHLRQAAARELQDAIRRTDWHLTTGFVGVGYLLPVLSSHGCDSTAYRLLEQRSRPSWRYMIENGATTIWERWDGWTSEHGFTSPAMNSFNHYSLGSVGEWLYRFVLGSSRGGINRLQPAGASPASRWPAQLGLRLLPVGPRAHRHPLAAVRRPVHLQRRATAEHDGQREDSQR